MEAFGAQLVLTPADQGTEGARQKEQDPRVQVIAVEPAEAPFISQGVFRPHRMMGTAPGFVPATLQREVIDDFFLVSEAEAFAMCRRLARTEGLLVGITPGASAHAASEIARKPSNEGKTVVAIFADSGERYLSVAGLFSNQTNG